MHIQYTGLSHFRELFAEDFERLGHVGHEAVTWARGEIIEVAHTVGETLLQVLGDEFQQVTEDVKVEAPKWLPETKAAPAIITPTE